MIKTFTQTDLIRYIYHETTAEETDAIDRALARDIELQQRYLELQDLVNDFDEGCLQPSQNVVSRIKDYSRSALQPEA